MTTNKLDVAATPTAQAPRPKASPQNGVRLWVLLGLLALVVGAYAYDYLVALPGALSGEKKIQDLVDGRNKQGVKESALVTPADIQKELGMQPTIVEKHPDQNYEVEYYCWWGPVPFLNTRRHFISVVYTGIEPRHFGSHYRNEKPPEEALPITQAPAGDEGQTIAEPESASGKPRESSSPTDKGADAAAATPADAQPAQSTTAPLEPTKDKAASDK